MPSHSAVFVFDLLALNVAFITFMDATIGVSTSVILGSHLHKQVPHNLSV